MATLVLPYTFIPNTTILAPQVNADFQAILAVVNGQLNYQNIVMIDYRGANTISWGAGVTGDTQPRIAMNTSLGLEGGPGGATVPDVQFSRSAATTWQIAAVGGGAATLDMNQGAVINTNLGMPMHGRLYGATGDPYGVTDIASTSNIYYGPTSLGNFITLENVTTGTLVTQTFAQATLALSGLTANTGYDVYATSASSTTITLSTSAWTGNTPPARGADIAGRLTKTGAVNSLLVGAFYAVSATTTKDNVGGRWISNVFNPIQRALVAQDNTASWTLTSNVAQSMNGNTTDGVGRFSIFSVSANYGLARMNNFVIGQSNTLGSIVNAGIGVNSTTVYFSVGSYQAYAINSQGTISSSAVSQGNIGFNYFQRLQSTSGGTALLYGTVNGYMEGVTFN